MTLILFYIWNWRRKNMNHCYFGCRRSKGMTSTIFSLKIYAVTFFCLKNGPMTRRLSHVFLPKIAHQSRNSGLFVAEYSFFSPFNKSSLSFLIDNYFKYTYTRRIIWWRKTAKALWCYNEVVYCLNFLLTINTYFFILFFIKIKDD